MPEHAVDEGQRVGCGGLKGLVSPGQELVPREGNFLPLPSNRLTQRVLDALKIGGGG